MDYYKLLGVPRSANSDEIRRAYRKAAMQFHPDKGLKAEKIYEINEAYEVLSDSKKRRGYDLLLPLDPESNNRKPPIFTMQEHLLEPDGFITIPENDWGLISALKKAYESTGSREWRVKKSEGDKREWMPKEVYLVRRQRGKVTVSRRLDDWRNEFDRDRNIEVTKVVKPPYRYKELMRSSSFFDERYLGADRRIILESCSVPPYFNEYLTSLKIFARKLTDIKKVEDFHEVLPEVVKMNSYGEYGSNNTRFEGKGFFQKDPNKEWVKKIGFDEFWKKMLEAEKTVTQVEGIHMSQESRMPSVDPIPRGYRV